MLREQAILAAMMVVMVLTLNCNYFLLRLRRAFSGRSVPD